MANKRRCTACREYFPASQMLRGGISGVCSVDCLQQLQDKYRNKRQRRIVHREKKVRYGRRLPGDVRTRVRARDRGRCRWCGTTANLNVHHVRYRSEGGPDDERNLIVLCRPHHDLAHSNKRRYQPVLLLALWLEYERGEHKTVRQVMHRARPELLDEAWVFSQGVLGRRQRAA